jgi:hypothetical protein
MRIRVFMSGMFLLLFAVSPAILRAQFQAPTDEELKMTADPKAPGADAVYLYVEEIDNDPLHSETVYERIKVLTEKGKELATVELPYLAGDSTIAGISGRTIHPDGTVIPLTAKPEELLNVKSGDTQIERKVFNLPSVEVGSILEFRFQLRYGQFRNIPPDWQVQRHYFVHKAHYQFTPYPDFIASNKSQGSSMMWYFHDERGRQITSLIWWANLPKGLEIKADMAGRYNLDLTDIAPAPSEAWMPPIESLLYKVHFYYKAAITPEQFWTDEPKYWSKDVDKFAEPTKTIHAAVDGLIAPGDADLVKAKKLYAAVQALDNTDYSRKRSESELKELNLKQARSAGDTWTQKSGSSEDIALLYLAMLRAAGLTAYAVKVVDRDRGVFDMSYMYLEQLNDTLVILSTGGKDVLLDPGEKMCPFQTLSWRHSSAKGIGQSAQGPVVTATPAQAFGANTLTRTGDIDIDEHGVITGKFQFVMVGQNALRWRQRALELDTPELKKEFEEQELDATVPTGVEAHVDHFLGLDDPDSLLMAVVNVKGTLGTATAKRLLLPGYFFETREQLPFVGQEKRLEPVDMKYADRVTDQVTYNLPASLKVEAAPPDAKIPWEGHAVYATKAMPSGDKVTIVRALVRAFTFAKPEEYQDLRGFYMKVAAADQQQMVLALAPAAKGN